MVNTLFVSIELNKVLYGLKFCCGFMAPALIKLLSVTWGFNLAVFALVANYIISFFNAGRYQTHGWNFFRFYHGEPSC